LHTQLLTAALPAFELELEGQLVQVLFEVAPVADEYVLLLQSKQSELPVTDLYFPATHVKHDPPFAPVYPNVHEQFVTTVLPAAETEFTGHAEQAAELTASLKKFA
jgi:hypothetical protein